MNQTITDMINRRSCRKFKPDAVPAELLDQIIEAGLYAASGMGRQTVKIIAVTDKTMRDKIAEDNRKIGQWNEGFDPFYGAPVILAVISDKNCSTCVYDGSLVMGNMMLAAHSLGLGSIWIHRAKEEFETPEYRELLKKLGIEGDYEGIGHCAIGFADCELPAPPERKPDRVYRID